jgi:hypothetical protein
MVGQNQKKGASDWIPDLWPGNIICGLSNHPNRLKRMIWRSKMLRSHSEWSVIFSLYVIDLSQKVGQLSISDWGKKLIKHQLSSLRYPWTRESQPFPFSRHIPNGIDSWETTGSVVLCAIGSFS